MPKLYVADYFLDLRNKVDKEMFLKQVIHKNDNEIKNELTKIWEELILQINWFEKQCNSKDKLQSNSNLIDEIRIFLDNQSK